MKYSKQIQSVINKILLSHLIHKVFWWCLKLSLCRLLLLFFLRNLLVILYKNNSCFLSGILLKVLYILSINKELYIASILCVNFSWVLQRKINSSCFLYVHFCRDYFLFLLFLIHAQDNLFLILFLNILFLIFKVVVLFLLLFICNFGSLYKLQILVNNCQVLALKRKAQEIHQRIPVEILKEKIHTNKVLNQELIFIIQQFDLCILASTKHETKTY